MVDDIATGPFAATGTPTNDLCSNASAISAGTQIFSSSTCYAADNLDGARMPGACSADSLNGREVFYWLSAAAGDTLEATATGPWSPVLYLVNSCTLTTGTCLNSSAAFQDGDITIASLRYVFASSGVYFLVLDGITSECGDFQLTTHIRDEVTGVETGESSLPLRAGLQVTPNPSGGRIRFIGRSGSAASSHGTLRVFDVAGRLVFEKDLKIFGDRFEESWGGLDAPGTRLSSGVYVVKATIGAEVLTTRFVLTR